MVARGYIIKVNESKKRNSGKFLLWIWYILHRYRLPNIIFFTVFFGILGYMQNSLLFFLIGIMLYEVFLFSIAIHETCHMACAKFLRADTKNILLIPYSYGIRTAFNRECKISGLDLTIILLAGPIIPIGICIPILFVIILLKMNIAFLLVLFFSVLINILSLLPFTGSDGQRAAVYLKNNKQHGKIIFFTLITFVLSSLRLVNMKNKE